MTTATSNEATSQSGRRPGLYLLIFLLALTPLLVPPIVPTIDFYDHIARYYVLSHLSDPFLAQNYAPRWAILPNIGMDVLGVGLAKIAPPLILAKLIVLIIFTVQYFGLLYFNRKLTGRDSLLVALLGVPLLYSFILTWGFANFLLGLGLSLWGAGWWLATRNRLALAIPTSMVIAVVIFLTHGFAFGLYGLLLGGLEIGFFLAAKPRSIVSFVTHMGGLAAQAIVPALLFRASATVKATEGVTNADEAVKRLAQHGGLMARLETLLAHRATTVVRVSEGPSLWFDVATNALLVGAVIYLATRRRVGLVVPAWPALALGIVLFAIIPPALFGVGYVGDRIPLFLALVAAGALTLKPGDSRSETRAVSFVAAIVAVKVVAVAVNWLPYRADYAAYEKVRGLIPQHSLVTTSNFANANRLDNHRRCEMYGPLMVPQGYAVPLFVIPTAQPMVLAGPLSDAMHAKPPASSKPPGFDRAVNRFVGIARSAHFDYIVACEAERVQIPADAAVDLVAREGRFSLYKLRGTPAPQAPVALR